MSETIRMVEVGPRDGLQNQAKPVSLASRRRYIELLLAAGVKHFEAGAFVRADRVPQMKDSERILEGIELHDAEAYFLVANEKGLERALAAKVRHIAVFTAATDGFNQRNIGLSMEESLATLTLLVPKALQEGLKIRGYVSVVWGCPYDGKPEMKNILHMVTALLDLGCFEVSLGDTIGVANPREVVSVLKQIGRKIDHKRLAVHFHDTRGMGIANVYAALQEGIRVVDASSGGLGGCPFAPGASGNVASEDVIYLTDGLGLTSGINLERLLEASLYIYRELGEKHFSSKTLQALVASGKKFK